MKKAALPPEMKPEIWGKLPEEILDYILSLLPLKTFFNLRSTCKHFNSLIFSPNFISKHSSSSLTNQPHSPPPFSSFLLLSHPQFHRQFLLYDSILSRWRILALSLSLPSSFGSAHLLCSSSNGLLCFSLLSSCSLLVCNLLARSSRLIDFPGHSFHFDSVTLIPYSQGGYRIFIISSGSAFVFDSKGNIWSQYSVFDAILKGNSHQEGVFSNGYLYFTTPEPFSIVGFEFETGKWERHLIQELPGEIAFARLVSNGGGKIYLVGGIGRHGISRSMKLWELRDNQVEGRRDWVEVGSLPDMMCRKFMAVCYHNYEHVYCFIHGGMICVCCYTWPEVLYYKISRQTWHWLPKCPSLPEKWSCGFRWFSFVPNLYTSV
ncbi:F-box domain [Macleaya cordata]|uniref:F-box domain n=1 Tax=Macleaya cordata TaxID=56857 RepID=A0A200PMW5_MACCD|nr:F-box domain [Macleaya cordata]